MNIVIAKVVRPEEIMEIARKLKEDHNITFMFYKRKSELLNHIDSADVVSIARDMTTEEIHVKLSSSLQNLNSFIKSGVFRDLYELEKFK